MKENAIEWKSYEAAKIHGETDLKKPPQLDFAGLAKQYGVTKGNTGEITRWDAQDKDIGKSIVLGFRQPFVNCVFDNLSKHSEIGKRSPVRSMTATDIFLFWKTKDIKETAAKWEDPAVQKQVLEAWQFDQARKPALDKAKKLAEEARTGKSLLKEVFTGIAGVEVVSPPPFTWLTNGYDPSNSQYWLNEDIKGVTFPGEAFMKTVFSLNAMGIGTAFNEPQTIAYVIQVEKFEPTNDALWNRFTNAGFNTYASAGMFDRQTADKALIEQLTKEAGVKWQRKADQIEKEDSSGK
jgi:hypothetical protein